MKKPISLLWRCRNKRSNTGNRHPRESGGYNVLSTEARKTSNAWGFYDMTLSRKKCLLFTVSIVMSCLSPIAWEATSFALNGADVAIYNDSCAPVDPVTGAKRSGTWQDGIASIKCMLNWMGLSHEEISYRDLNDSNEDFSRLYKVLLFPGGFAYWYNYWISLSGKDRIRNFVNDGGGYFGICAGSFFASDTVVWEGVSYGDRYLHNAYGELTGYNLDLFSGTATGPINGIAPWPTYGITTINFEKESEILSDYKVTPFSEGIFYYGGPYFTSSQDKNVKDLGVYDYNGEPALVAFTYGSGRVVLTGPHPEIAFQLLQTLVFAFPAPIITGICTVFC